MSRDKEHKKIKDIQKIRYGLEQWKALITSFLLQSLIMGTLESYGALYVPMKESILADDKNKNTKAALIGSLTTGCLMGFSPISSILIEKYGCQLMALLGSYLVFFSTLITSFVNTYFLVVLLYGAVFGIGASLLFISSNVVISRYFEENSTIAYGILGLGNGIMNCIMPHVMNFCVERIMLSGTIRLICFMLSFIMFFPLYWNMNELPMEKEESFNPFLMSNLRQSVVRKTRLMEEFASYKTIGNKITFNRISAMLTSKPLVSNSTAGKSGSMNNANTAKTKPENAKPNKYLLHKLDSSLSENSLPLHTRFASKMNFLRPSMLKFPISSSKKGSINSTSTIDPALVNKRKTTFESRDSITAFFKKFNCCRQSKVLKNRAFVTLLCAMPIAMLGYQVANVHIVNFSNKMFPDSNGQLLLTCLGGASAIGPFINALIIDRLPFEVSKYRLYQVFVIFYGMTVLTLAVASKYPHLLAICLGIGYLDGSLTSLMGPLAIDLVGGKLAGEAIGMFYGVIAPSVMIAPPLAGFIYDMTHNYKPAFYTAGVCFMIGGLLLSISCTSATHIDESDHSEELSNIDDDNRKLSVPEPRDGADSPILSESTETTERFDVDALHSRPLFKRN